MGAAAGERVPLHWLWNEKDTDSAYAISTDAIGRYLASGYRDMGAVAMVDAELKAGTFPLVCFYKGPPATDTFCSLSAVEQRLVKEMGFKHVGTAGFLFRDRVRGSFPVFRMSRDYGPSQRDREHRLVFDESLIPAMSKEGWTMDGTKAYVMGVPDQK
jgi:hypothetical protein